MKKPGAVNSRVDFDAYTETYEQEIQRAIGFSRRKHEFFLDAKADVIVELCQRRLGSTRSLNALDVGCGVGLLASRLAARFASLHGIDPSEQSVQAARKAAPAAHVQAYDGKRLPFAVQTFDIAFSTLVFHHVPSYEWYSLLLEMKRVVRPGGLVALIEHNPWNPLTRLVVNRCEFDRDATLLAEPLMRRLFSASNLRQVETRFFLFLPWRISAFNRAAKAMSWLPLGAQYLVAGTK